VRSLEQFPWEVKFPEEFFVYRVPQGHFRLSNTIRSMQRSLVFRTNTQLRVDGILGPETTAVLRGIEAADASDLRMQLMRPPAVQKRVLLIQADLEESRFLKRGHGAEGIQTNAMYSNLGVLAFECVYTGFKELARNYSASNVRVIHLVSSFWETPGGEFVPDISRSAGEPLTAQQLASVLHVRGAGDVAPIVIVEGILPPSAFDLRVQGIARNRFCADLFAAGDFKAVIGTGLWEAKSIAHFVQRISASLTLRELWRNAPRSRDWPPVLFTSDPDLPIWES
jgi:hypothetical protein